MSPVFASPLSGANDVREIQRALNRAGGSTFPTLAEDGIMGPKTKARVLEFQRAKGLKPDGIVGTQTRTALGLLPSPSFTPPPFPTPRAGGSPVNSSAVVTAVVAGTKAAFVSWKLSAMFRDIRIFGPTATGSPGCVTGPNLTPFIGMQLGALQGDDRAVALGAAVGIGTNFAVYQIGLTVPGLPWYPAFAAFPGPEAPPMPNVPTPLIALPSRGFTGITSVALLKNAMEQAAGPAVTAKAGTAFADIAVQATQFFLQAISTTFVAGVMGLGPVPTFAPPFVPVGPVANGRVLSTPGNFA